MLEQEINSSKCVMEAKQFHVRNLFMQGTTSSAVSAAPCPTDDVSPWLSGSDTFMEPSQLLCPEKHMQMALVSVPLFSSTTTDASSSSGFRPLFSGWIHGSSGKNINLVPGSQRCSKKLKYLCKLEQEDETNRNYPRVSLLDELKLLHYSAPPWVWSERVLVGKDEMARRRRRKVAERFETLQKLMPTKRKMDTATMLGEATKYVKFLEAQVRTLNWMPLQAMDSSSSTTTPSRQQLLQVMVNSAPVQNQLYSNGWCVFSAEQVELLKRLSSASLDIFSSSRSFHEVDALVQLGANKLHPTSCCSLKLEFWTLMLGSTMVLHLGKSFFLSNFPRMTESGVGMENLCFVHLPMEKKVQSLLAIRVGENQDFNSLTHHQKAKKLIPCAKASGEKDRKVKNKNGKTEHHLWMKRDSAGSGRKALNLVHIISKLPNEREVIYGALDKWTAFETEFPLIAAAKALTILRRRKQWSRIIQVSKWMLSKGQGMSMGTYDTLLLAFDMDGRVDEAESLWNTILQRHTRSVSRRLFSRMISLYDHHHMPDKITEVFADMEELGVKPDEDTVKRIGSAFRKAGEEDKEKLLTKKYEKKWRYLHFKGERVRVRPTPSWDEIAGQIRILLR
ncbi:hypothetical protein H6P81_007182 [Aristolochia fimbriata]|uniref:BHLH domain-containing protein n=1 Tax=Aristolochia fimbriata TaxID=158543 RepID=A0AAV7F3Z1_ARIFI|nr:hypothetical protein H6P81_007182 [Aristolochia fimbriata]